MSKWGPPQRYRCRVLTNPERNIWAEVATPEEAEKYPVHKIALRFAISASAFADIYKGNSK